MGRQIGASFKIEGIKRTVDGLASLEFHLNGINKELREAKKVGDFDSFRKLKRSQESFRNEIKETRKELRAQQRDLRADRFPKDSIIGLENAYSKLRKEIRATSKADPRFITMTQQARKLKDEIRKTSMAFGDTTSNIGNYVSAFRGLNNLLAGAGIFLGVREFVDAIQDSTQVFNGFNQQVQTLGAISGASRQELLRLEEQALTLGGATQFTAEEIAKLQTALARLGFSSQEIETSTEAITNLSIATGEEIEKTAKTVGQTIRAYGLEAQDAEHVTNVLTASFNSSALQLETFREASKLLAPTARVLNVSLEESTAAIGLLADSGLEGTIATETLQSSLQRLADPTKKYAEAAARLNIEVFNQKGQFVGLANLMKNVETATAGFSEQQKLAAISQIFGVRSARNWATALNSSKEVVTETGTEVLKGGEALEAYTQQLANSAGEAKRTADFVGNTLAQDMLKLKSATEAAQIAFIGLFEDGIRGAVQGLTSFVQGIADFLKQPVSDKLKEEQQEYNILLQSLINVNDNQAARQLLIDEIQAKYPDYIGNLNLETATTEQLRANLEEVNKEFAKRIILQEQEEKLAEVTQRQVELTKQLVGIEKQRAAGVTTFQTGVNSSINVQEALRQKQEQINDVNAEFSAIIQEQTLLLEKFGISAESTQGGINEKTKESKDGISEVGATLIEESLSFEQLQKKFISLQEKLNNIISKDNFDVGVLEETQKELKEVSDQLENISNLRRGQSGNLAQLGGVQFDDPLDAFFAVANEIDSVGEFRKKREEEIDKAIIKKNEENRDAANQRRLAKEKEQLEKEAALRKQYEDQAKEAILSSIESGISAAFDIRRQAQESEFRQREELIQRSFDSEIEAAQGNQALQDQLRAERDRELEDLRREQFEKGKETAVKEALIQGALAIVRTFAQFGFPAGLIPAAGQAIATGAQVATIRAQEFAEGGTVIPVEGLNGDINVRPNIKRTRKGDNVIAKVAVGEKILNAQQQRKAEFIYGAGIWKNIGLPKPKRQSGIAAFAEGGVVGGIPQVVRPTNSITNTQTIQTVNVGISDDQIEKIALRLASRTGEAVSKGLGKGLSDANRRLEREQIAQQQTGIN